MNPRRIGYGLILVSLAAHPMLNAQSSFTVASAASYQLTVAPDSLASMFGANLAPATASAALDANGQLPTQLGGVGVDVDGQAASLIYVSPSQINFVIPGSATPGTASVVVRPAGGDAGGATRSGTMQVQNTAAGVFTADASGTGPGSILNAITYAGAPFLVETSANSGADKRTRLSVYATGLRYAGNPSHDPTMTNVAASVQADAQTVSGQRYSLVVEYAGAAPGFFGLDQVNVVLPPELDGAGTVSLTLSTDASTSNIVSFAMGSLPADAIGLTSLVLSRSFVTAGDSVTGTVSLNAAARSIGFQVSLRANNPAVQMPLLVTIPAGTASAQFSITTSAVSSVQTVTITAQGNGATQTASLEIDPVNSLQLNSFLVTPASVQGGRAASATVTLSGASPSGGAAVQVSSDNSAAEPPATVAIPFGSNSATFSVPTPTVTATQTATMTASYGRSNKTAQLTVVPVLQLTLKNNAVVGGNSVNGTVTLGEAAPVAGVTLTVQCDNRTVAQPPLTVTILSGQTSVAFTVTTVPVTVARTVTITVAYAGSTQSASLTVNPVGSASLANLTISPDHVTGGTNTTGTATLGAPAPAGGTPVNLLSNAVFVAQVPQFVSVPQGQTSATFTIVTSHVTTVQTVTITGSAAGVSKTAMLTVQ
jgi:uncharacterized protein (TIGR03437 family)